MPGKKEAVLVRKDLWQAMIDAARFAHAALKNPAVHDTEKAKAAIAAALRKISPLPLED